MRLERTSLDGVVIVTPPRYSDARGFFSETWNRRRLREAGIDIDWVQDNHSLSRPVHTLRGLHYQAPPHPQAKLVRCIRGRILDVAVDIRRNSPTFGKWTSVALSAENGRQLLVPAGFLHGFVTLEPDTEVTYKCSDYYAPECDGAVRFDSPALGIDWGVSPDAVVLSDKDARAIPWDGFDSPF